MTLLEDYTLLKELGQGGYAIVYKARHNKLGYIRAIRALNAMIVNEQDEKYQKFLEECRLLLRLGNGNHPNIVHIYQPLLRANRAIVEMDFVDGKNLSEYMENKSAFVEIEDVLKLLTDISSALAYCHEDIYKFCMNIEDDNLEPDPNDGSKILLTEEQRNELIKKYRVIHNDIHSGNIIRREDGNFILLDFGLAVEGNNVVRSSRRKNGVPEFKAPEKWDNDGILTTQSDIYSFGVVLYEFLAGRVPFEFDKKNSNPTEAEYLLCKAHKDKLPEPIYDFRKKAFEKTHPGEKYEKDYPDWLEELIMKCLAKKPEDRFRNGKELYKYVRRHLDERDLLRDLKEQNGRLHSELKKLQSEIDTLRQTVKNKDILLLLLSIKGHAYKKEADKTEKKKKSGNGTATETEIRYENGSRYVGSVVKGRRHGKGTMYYADGVKYEGNWENDKKQGHGICYLDNGDKIYDGNWENGKYHGLGTHYYYNGKKYVGHFVNGKRHGQGTYYYADGSKYNGIWKDGVLVKETK